MHTAFQSFVDALAKRFDGNEAPSPEALIQVAEELKSLAQHAEFDRCRYPEAQTGQEIVYHLTGAHANGPSLYLVSDGSGTSSPPHEHKTWAVVVGLDGTEVNSLYELTQGIEHSVQKVREHEVGPGSAFALGVDRIHSTFVLGNNPTYHLHLYGRPLSSLPSFHSRCFPYPSVA